MRIDLIDGMRGHLLIGMMLAHLTFQSGYYFLINFHHAKLLRVYDAEFFIIISGFLVGYLFSRKASDNRWLFNFVGNRLKIIYKYYLVSAIPFLFFYFLENGGSNWFGTILSVLCLQRGGAYSDILPIYFYCFLGLSLFYFLFRGSLVVIAIASVAIFFVSQFSYETGIWILSNELVVFDILAWQILFILPFVAGIRYVELGQFIASMSPTSVYLTLAAALLVLVADRAFYLYAPLIAVPEHVMANWPRMQLHPFFLLKSSAIAIAVTLLVARRDTLVAWVHDLLRWYFSLRILRNVGSYSIQMFTIHVFMIALFKNYLVKTSSFNNPATVVAMIVVFIALPNAWKLARGQWPRKSHA